MSLIFSFLTEVIKLHTSVKEDLKKEDPKIETIEPTDEEIKEATQQAFSSYGAVFTNLKDK